jgi:type VI secretion system protein ImpC
VEDALEALLAMVELPETADKASPRRAESVLDQVVSLIMRSDERAEPADRRSADAVLADLDAVIGAQVDDVLHHGEFRRLESVWRGLKFLVDRTDFRQDIQLEVLSAAKASLLDAFQRWVVEPEYEGIGEAPISAVIAAYEFDCTHQDIALLQELAQKLEALQVPCLTSVGAAFFGLNSADGIARLPSIDAHLQRPEYIKWQSFRDSEASRWLSIACNGVLLRLPYGPEGQRVPSFDFRESLLGAADAYLWGNPVWAVATLLTASFARIGWPTEICGVQHGGAIDDLPVRAYQPRSAAAMTIPLEAWIPEQRCWELVENGLLPLTCRPNSDVAVVLAAPTAHRPELYTDAMTTADSALRATLPYQLMASRLVHHISALYSRVVPGNTPEGIAREFAQALRACLSTAGELGADAVNVEITASRGNPGLYELTLRARPGQQILGGRAAVELRLQIRP